MAGLGARPMRAILLSAAPPPPSASWRRFGSQLHCWNHSYCIKVLHCIEVLHGYFFYLNDELEIKGAILPVVLEVGEL